MKQDNLKDLSEIDMNQGQESVKNRLSSLTISIILLLCFWGIWVISAEFGRAINDSVKKVVTDISDVEAYNPVQSTLIYDINDNLIANKHGEEDRVLVSLDNISKYLIKAVMAIEDHQFYEHNGVNLKSIFRAIVTNLKSGDTLQGGSTITQQLVKNLFLTPEKNIGRKMAEAVLAVRLEQMYDKDKILEMYVNQVYWGNRSYGIEKAAKRYFNKTAAMLDIAESAMLAGLLKAPSQYSPYTNFKQAKQRQLTVIEQMYKYGYITLAQKKAAENQELVFRQSQEQHSKYAYFISHVINELISKYGEEYVNRGGLKVYTTLDPEVQDLAETTLTNYVHSLPQYTRVKNGALVSINVDTGYIQAIVGGTNFLQSNFNRATQSRRAAGSSFKPVVYLTAFMQGAITPDTTIQDNPLTFNDGWTVWTPKNWDNKFWGTMSVRRALAHSRNLPTVRIAQKVGVPAIIDTARKLGITTELSNNLSIALGSAGISPLEMANLFATFAREGVYTPPIIIRRVEDNSGRILDSYTAEPETIFEAEPIANINSILQDAVKYGTATGARLSDRPVAGKTGTTDDVRDIWFTGYTPDTVTTIWMGNDENKPLKGVFSSNCVRAWANFTREYYKLKKIPPRPFHTPASYLKNATDEFNEEATENTVQEDPSIQTESNDSLTEPEKTSIKSISLPPGKPIVEKQSGTKPIEIPELREKPSLHIPIPESQPNNTEQEPKEEVQE